MKKGFTLVELLAVIVILAVILLIIIPVVQKTVLKSQTTAREASITMYGKALESAATMYQLTEKKDPTNITEAKKYLKYSGSTVTCDVENLNSDFTVYLEGCSVDGKSVEGYTYGSKDLTSGSYVYMWNTGEVVYGPSLNEVIEDPTQYSQTAPIDKDYYLKFKLDNTNKVIEGYACAVFDGTPYCVQGWELEAYGSYTGMSSTASYDVSNLNPTGNIAIINSIKTANPSYSCSFNSYNSYCFDGSVGLDADSDGVVHATTDGGGDGYCGVVIDGGSNCGGW